MPGHDLVCDPKAEAGADIFLGSKEWIEDSRGVLRRDAWAAVFDNQFGGWALRGIAGRAVDGNFAAERHSIDGVGEQVGDDLFEFAWRAPCGRAVV